MWTEDSLKIGKNIYKYWVKHFEEGSEFGIDGGKISKLTIKKNGKEVYNYDRGLDIAPTDKETETALQKILKKYN